MVSKHRELLLALGCFGLAGALLFVILSYDRSLWARYTLRFLLCCLVAFLSLSRRKI